MRQNVKSAIGSFIDSCPACRTTNQWSVNPHVSRRSSARDISRHLVGIAIDHYEITRFEGEQGFLRGTLRALIRERKRRDLGSVDPFYLQGHQDGRMTLRDPGTGTRIPLDSFGPSQLALFLPLRDTPVAVSVRISGETP